MTGGGIWSKKIQFYVGGFEGISENTLIKYILKLWSGKHAENVQSKNVEII